MGERSPEPAPSEVDKLTMKTRILCAVVAAGMIGSVQASAQDVAAGEAVFQKVCKTCHGPKAQGLASFPKLAGNSADYLSMRLEQYRAGEKVGANTPLMAPHAAKLSDEDIANIATYIATSFE